MSHVCTKCGIEQNADQYRMINHKNGRQYRDTWCRGCKRIANRAWKIRNKERVGQINRASDRRRYWSDPEAGRAKKVAHYHAHSEAWLERSRSAPLERKRAVWRIHELTRSGRLQRPDRCQKCGGRGQRIEAHHPNHANPETIEWLCSACHGLTRRMA